MSATKENTWKIMNLLTSIWEVREIFHEVMGQLNFKEKPDFSKLQERTISISIGNHKEMVLGRRNCWDTSHRRDGVATTFVCI